MNRHALNKLRLGAFFSLLLIIAAPAVFAGHPLMARTQNSFPDTMLDLQEALKAKGYSIAHIQKCDGGLKGMGYKSDFYRVIFFGKLEEVREISSKHPKMVAFLPLKIAVFAENDETVMAAVNPGDLSAMLNEPELEPYLRQWDQDIREVLEQVRHDRNGE